MTDIVIGTAGHIDHGKTTLIKALTGIETDTSLEEKKRGLSINLGFAYLDLPNQQRVGVVDVPGHERFIKNMVAGLPGINLVLLVIDAAEGIMPQTKEHIDILTLLGVNNFLVVLTKVETVDPDLKELVIEDIKEQLENTALENSPIIETDAVAGVGIESLQLAIQHVAEKSIATPEKEAARLNVDRSFSVKGFGTVITGTLLDASLSVGDELTVYPKGIQTKIRNIQVHEVNRTQAFPGQRVALNLTNISTEEVTRGDVLTNKPAQLMDSWMLDAKATCLKTIGLGMNLWHRVRLLIGTREVFARIVPIGKETIEPGEEGYIQLRLEESVAVKPGDHFILRSYSPLKTIGGGIILDATPAKHRRFKQEVLDSLIVKEEGSFDKVILDFLASQSSIISSTKELINYLGVEATVLEHLLDEMVSTRQIVCIRKNEYIHPARLAQLAQKAQKELANYHKLYRLRKGMPLEELRSKFKQQLNPNQIDAIFTLLVKEGKIVQHSQIYALCDFDVTFNSYQLAAKESILKKLEEQIFTPLKVDDLATLDKNAREVLEALNGQEIVYLTHEYVLSQSDFKQAIQLLTNYINTHGHITLGDFRDLTQSSRKSSMLILEHIDKQGITKRVENTRILA